MPAPKSGRGGRREGAGRPPLTGEALQDINVSLPVPLIADLDTEAREREVSRSQVVRDRLSK